MSEQEEERGVRGVEVEEEEEELPVLLDHERELGGCTFDLL